MNTDKPIASLSLDLDNLWSYMKTHGDPGWERFPSYLDLVVPISLDLLAEFGLRITYFIVGQDAALPKNANALRTIAKAGHEIGNHSFKHEPWLHLYSPAEIDSELAKAETAIQEATGQRPYGFRGPGFSLSRATLDSLARRGYRYDASTFPTFLGPLARAYYFRKAKLSREERRRRKALFGRFSEGFRALNPYRWELGGARLLEIPVTTMPVLKVPFHLSYIVYLAAYSPRLAQAYFETALRLCRLFGVTPSLLLHPLDFIGKGEVPGLDFFPGMNMEGAAKRAIVREVLFRYTRRFNVVSVGEHAAQSESGGQLQTVVPAFPKTPDQAPKPAAA